MMAILPERHRCLELSLMRVNYRYEGIGCGAYGRRFSFLPVPALDRKTRKIFEDWMEDR